MYTNNDFQKQPDWYIQGTAQANLDDDTLKSKEQSGNLLQLHVTIFGKALEYLNALFSAFSSYISSFFDNRTVVNKTEMEANSAPQTVFDKALISKLPETKEPKELLDPTPVGVLLAATEGLGMVVGPAYQTAQLASFLILNCPLVQEAILKNKTVQDLSQLVKKEVVKLREPAIVFTHNAVIKSLEVVAFVGSYVPGVKQANNQITGAVQGVDNNLPSFAQPFFEAAVDLHKEELVDAGAEQLSAFVLNKIATPLVDSATAVAVKGFNDYMLNRAVLTTKSAPAALRAVGLLFVNGAPKNNKDLILNMLRVGVLFSTGSPLAAMVVVYGAHTMIYAVKVNQRRMEIADRKNKEKEAATAPSAKKQTHQNFDWLGFANAANTQRLNVSNPFLPKEEEAANPFAKEMESQEAGNPFAQVMEPKSTFRIEEIKEEEHIEQATPSTALDLFW